MIAELPMINNNWLLFIKGSFYFDLMPNIQAILEEARAPMGKMRFKHSAALIFIGLYIVIYYGWIMGWEDKPSLQVLGGNLLSFTAAFLSAIALLFASYRSDKGHKIFWLLLSLGSLSYFVAEGTWIFYENIKKIEVPFPGIADVFYLMQIGFYLAAFTYKIFMERNRHEIARFLFDVSIVMVVAATFSMQFLIKPILAFTDVSNWFLLFSLGYPVGDLMLLLSALTISHLWKDVKLKKGFIIIFAGLLVQIFADTSYLYLLARDAYVSGSPIDPLYALGLLLIGYAGVFYPVIGRKIAVTHKLDNLKAGNVYRQMIPYICVLILFLFVFFYESNDRTLTIGSGIAILLIIYRQLAMIVENRRLLKRFHERTLELAINKQRYKSLFEYHPDGVFSIDLDGVFVTANDACSGIIGYTKDEIIGKSAFSFISAQNRPKMTNYFIKAKEGTSQKFELLIKNRAGQELFVAFTIVPIIIDNKIAGIFGITRDITENKKNEEKISYMAYHDLLTNLPNRRLFEKILNQSILDAKRTESMLAVMFIDLDRFKYVNDTFGHNAGDQLLLQVAQRLETCLRSNDVVARQGGDEFTLLAKGIKEIEDAGLIAEKILKSLNETFYIDGREIRCTPSIGISIYHRDGNTTADLMKAADRAMYKAKENGKNGYFIYTSDVTEQPSRKLLLETALTKAIEHDELSLHYQPQVNAETGEISGVEALVRWNHPEMGFIPVSEFIPIAEETGLIVPIGEWIIRTSCEQAQKWNQAGFPLKLAVNVSPRQFHQKDFVDMLSKIQIETGLSFKQLDLEITEGIAMGDRQIITQKLMELRNLNIQVSVDDFGTGYSSLAYLTNFPIETLKIAREFVEKIGIDKGNEAIIASIITMANNLGLKVIAEGVETKEQSNFLLSLGCKQMQGYYYSKPLPALEFERLLKVESFV